MTFLQLGMLLSRSRRLKAFRQARAEADVFSDADLADMGIKRWQLSHADRIKTLR